MILYSVSSPFDTFPFSAPVNSVKPISGGYIEYRKIYGVNTVVALHSTNPYDYISSQYFNPNLNFRRKV